MPVLTRRSLVAGLSLMGLAGSRALAATAADGASPADAEAWKGLVADVFLDKPMTVDPAVIDLEAPYRAEDAAIVPIALVIGSAADDAARVVKVTITVDNNPAPVAATFELGAGAGVARIETRVRVNQYTNIHAVAERADGSLVVATKYVKASGGCSAPALKNAEEALANVGVMRLKQFPAEGSSRPREAQLMIRHPQYSGLQMDQMTHNYIPAWFITDLSIAQGTDLIFRVSGGISLSEDPNLRFRYRSNGAELLKAEATDTEGKTYTGEWKAEGSS